MVEPATATLIAAAIGAATAAAATATSATIGAVANYNSIGDAMTASVLNLSRRNWKVKLNTGDPIKGEWMVPPSNLTSFHNIVHDNKGASEAQIKEMVKALGEEAGIGFQPWMTCTLANAGGYWGPASLIVLQDPEDQMTVSLLMLIRPGYNYCAGVSLSRMWIGTQGDGKGWELFHHIENIHTDKCQFSDGVRKAVSWNGVKVTWQPGKEMKFTIEDA